MKLTVQEHTTALFIVAFYCWLTGEEENAKSVLEVAIRVSESPPHYA